MEENPSLIGGIVPGRKTFLFMAGYIASNIPGRDVYMQHNYSG